MKFATLFLSALFILSSSVTASARDWNDLHEDEADIFGSEKFEKYPINAFIVEHEKWENHESLMAFWFFKITDYPKYHATRVFPFYLSLDSKIDNRSYKFSPLFLTYGETDGNEDFRINPLFIDYKHNRSAGSDYYERLNLSLLHVYWSEEWKQSAAPDRVLWFPIVPLIYRHTTDQGGHQNLFWLLDYAWDRKADGTENTTRFWFMPFFFHGFGDDGYTTILPPVFVWNRHTNGEKWMHLIPLFYHDKTFEYDYSGKTRSVTAENSFISLFYNSVTRRKENFDGELTMLRRWFPIIPFVYWYSDYGNEYHRNLFWLFDWHNDANSETDRFWALPAFMWKKDSYTHVLPPLFMHFRDEELSSTYVLPPVFINRTHADGERYTHMLPLFSYDKSIMKDPVGKQTGYESSSYSLLHGYQAERKEDWDSERTMLRFWFPLVPVFYSYANYGVESHRNLAWLIDWHNDANSEMDRLWMAPAFFWKKDSYAHVLPPLFMHFKDEKLSSTYVLPPLFINRKHSSGERYTHFLPFGVYTKSLGDTPNEYRSSSFSLLHGYRAKHEGSWDGELTSRSWWFPILPLIVYHSWDKEEGSSTRILCLFNFDSGGKDAESGEKRPRSFSFFPLVKWAGDEGGTRYIFPYIRPSGWTEERGYSFIPGLYYHRWDKDEDVKWSLLYYGRDNSATNEHVNMLFPIWYTKSTQDWEVSSKLFAYFYYNHPKDKYFARVVAPLYWNIDTPERESTLFLPLYFTTQRRDGAGRFHLNIIGGCTSLLAGTNPLATAGAGFNERGIYFDSDISWLYNMFSVSTRATIPLSKTRFASLLPESFEEKKSETQEDEKKTTLSDRLDTSREKSISFFRFDLLYGLFSYQAADTKRHLRILPLSYVTWDSASDTKDSWVLPPLIRYYKDDTTRINFFLPFYAYYRNNDFTWGWFWLYLFQKQGDSHREGYGLIAYWNEYDAPSNETERTVLSPLFLNWYNSPARSGWRFTPLLTWHKRHAEEYGSYHRTIILPLLSFHSGTDDFDGKTLSSFFINPLFYRNFTHEESDTSVETHERWNSTLPLVGYRSSERTDYAVIPAAKKGDKPSYAETNTFASHFWGPLWYSYKEHGSDTRTGLATNGHFKLVLPLYMSWSGTSTTNGKPDTETDGSLFVLAPAFVPLYVKYQNGGAVTKGFLANLYWNEYDPKTQSSDSSLLWPVFNWYSTPNTSGWRMFPIIWHKYYLEAGLEQRYNFILPLLSYQSSVEKPDGESLENFYLNPLFYINNSRNPYGEWRGWNTTLPLVGWRHSTLYKKPNAPDDVQSESKTCWAAPLFYWSRDVSAYGSNGGTFTESRFIGLPLIYSHKTVTRVNGSDRIDSTFFALGYYRTREGDSSHWSFLAGLLQSSEKSEDGLTSTASYLWGLSKFETRPDGRTNYLFPLWYYTREAGYRSFYLALGAFHFMRDDAADESRTSFAWWLFNTSRRNSEIYTDAGSRPVKERTTWAFPFAYYRHGETTDSAAKETYLTWFAPFVPLIYHHSDSEGSRTNIGWLLDIGKTEHSTRVWMMPLWFSRTGGTGYCSLLPLWHHSWDDAEGKSLWMTPLSYSRTTGIGTQFEETTRWFPIIPLIYTNSTKERFHGNILGVIDWRNDAATTRGWVFPFAFWRSGSDGYFHLLPVYLSSWNDEQKDRWTFAFGLYHRENPAYKRWNALYIADFIRKPKERYTNIGIALHIVDFEVTPEIWKMRTVWGLLSNSEFSRTNGDYNVQGLLYLAALSRRGDEFHSRLLPLWYYTHTKDSYTCVVPPLLSWFSKNSDGSKRQFAALGALWTRWYDPAEQSDLQLALLGIPYYHTQKAERGFTSEGSLWGILWDHEHETETGYDKISILKFLYKRVELDGKTYHSVFGIRF